MWSETPIGLVPIAAVSVSIERHNRNMLNTVTESDRNILFINNYIPVC